MKITLNLATDERIALRRLSNETGEDLADAAHIALREWLIAHGYLEPLHELDEDTATEGNG